MKIKSPSKKSQFLQKELLMKYLRTIIMVEIPGIGGLRSLSATINNQKF
jgi:hypothetical protein